MKGTTAKLFFSLTLVCAFSSVAHAQASEARNQPTPSQYVNDASGFFRARQYDRAVELYKQAIGLDPSYCIAYIGLGVSYINMGRSGDALAPLQTAVRLEPNNSMAHLNLGITLANLRRGDEALAELNEAKRLTPDDVRVYVHLGNILSYILGRPEEALAAYTEARRLNPNDADVQYNIGFALLRLERLPETIAPFQEALRLQPRHRNARYYLSDVLTKLGRYEEAADSWGKFLEIVPDGPQALTNRAWVYLYMGSHGREAAESARRFIDVHGWRAEPAIYLALVAHIGYREAGMDDEARAILEEATSKTGTGAWPFPVIRYLKGEIGADELLRLASDNDKKTEAQTYAGMDALLAGRSDEARERFTWVRTYGNKRFLEYPLAAAELKRLGR